jgi:hypothetical protein
MAITTLGNARFDSPLKFTVSDDVRIPEHIESGAVPGQLFELAGPRAKLFFDPQRTRAGIVTCGGLCPGLNNIIRSLVLELHYGYGVPDVLGFVGGYAGLDPACRTEPLALDPAFVHDIHQKGGTVLSTSRGPATAPSAARWSSSTKLAAATMTWQSSAYRKRSTTTSDSSRAHSVISLLSRKPAACSSVRTPRPSALRTASAWSS